MVKDVYRILRTLEADPNIKCLVIMSAIDKALSAGGDVVSLIQQTDYRVSNPISSAVTPTHRKVVSPCFALNVAHPNFLVSILPP